MINHIVSRPEVTESILGLSVHFLKSNMLKAPFDGSFTVGRMSVLLVESGHICLKLRASVLRLQKHDLVAIPKGTLCQVIDMCPRLEIGLLSFTFDCLMENSLKASRTEFLKLALGSSFGKISLGRQHYRNMRYLLRMLQIKSNVRSGNPFRKELLLLNFNLVALELGVLLSSNITHATSTRKEKLALQFFAVLEANCRKQHGVKFYAEALCITPGHLNKSIKKITGKTAKQFIEGAVITEAKALLEESHLPISRITEELEFSNTSFFSNFFKKHTSLSPTEFRRCTE